MTLQDNVLVTLLKYSVLVFKLDLKFVKREL
jgi:hypothetical protein